VIASSKQTQFLSYGTSPFFSIAVWNYQRVLRIWAPCLLEHHRSDFTQAVLVWWTPFSSPGQIILCLVRYICMIEFYIGLSVNSRYPQHIPSLLVPGALRSILWDNTAAYPIVWFHHYQHTGYLRSYLCVWAASQHTRSQTCLGEHSHFSREPHLQTVIVFISMDLHRMVPPSFLFVGLET
jgi:hypothetical protein